METLFRFNVVRESSRSLHEVDPIDLAASTQFQKDASEIPADDDRPNRLRGLAEEYIESSRFIPDPASQSDLESLERVAAAIEDLIDEGSTARFEIEAGLYDVIGSDYVDFVESSSLRGLITRAGDSVLAIKLSPGHHHLPIHRLVTVVQAFHLVQRFVEDRNFPESTEELAANRRRPLLVPEVMLPNRPAPAPNEASPPVSDRLEELAAQYEGVERAIAELRAVRPSGYGATPQQDSKAKLAPVALRPQALLKQALETRQGKTATDADSEDPVPAGEIGATSPGVSLASGARVALTGRASFHPVVAGLVGMRLSQEAQDGLSHATHTLLNDQGLSVAEPIGRTLRALIAERRRIHDEAQTLVRPAPTTSLKRLGANLVRITSPSQPEVFALSPGQLVGVVVGAHPDPAEGALLPLAEVARSRVMDLFVVRQQLQGYERGEASQIINYLRGEKTDRSFRHRHETEYAASAEAEERVVQDQPLTTGDRFEIRRESETALRDEAVAGVKGAYGPTIELGPSEDASLRRRTLAAERAANDFARNVTQRASDRVTEGARRVGSLRRSHQLEKTDQRSFDNTDGLGHVSGVYQWVTKVYVAQVHHYGTRTVCEIQIPEPASMLLETLQGAVVADVELERPTPFDLTPDQVTEDNYQTFVRLYGATGVEPPPEPFLSETWDFASDGKSEGSKLASSTTISVRDGYQAIRASVGAVVAVWDDWSVNVVVGQRAHRFSDGSSWVWSTPLDEETGGIPVAMVSDNVADLGVTIEVICEATERATDLWRAETHARLADAYRARVSEFETRLELEEEATDSDPGGAEYRSLADLTDAVRTATMTILSRGAGLRFFERAFEWENLSWAGSGGVDEPDAGLEALLRADFLRVQIPIRPGFTSAVDHLRVFGEPWLGGPLPPISDPAYLPVAEEIAALSTERGTEIPIGEPWEVRVPTNLEILREDDELPGWERQPDGSWEET